MAIPRPEDYGVSRISGFLPEQVPLAQLPPEFDIWEKTAQDLPALIHTQQLRPVVSGIPVLNTLKLHFVEQKRRAYSVLGFLAHAYVWSPPSVCERLPQQIAEPLLAVSEDLGLPPLATFAGLCLWNFRTVVPCENVDWCLENLAAVTLYTGSYDEAWFYTMSVALERQGGPCIAHGLNALDAAHKGDPVSVVSCLKQLETEIDGLTKILGRMPDYLDPHFFYHRLRPYLAGWKNMESAGLPNGVYYGDETEPRVYSGGSNGQSSLVQVLDILLSVNHAPSHASESTQTGLAADSAKKVAFLTQMRQYMPREHREFLNDLEKVATIREFVVNSKDDVLIDAYDAALRALCDFRSKHIQIVMRYISLQAREKGKVGLSKSNGSVGTGGTLLMPFLKQSRNEVIDAAAGNWGKSILTNTYGLKK